MGSAASAKILTVTPQNFDTVYKNVQAKDVLQMTGVFDDLKLTSRSFAAPVMIDATNAQFTGTISLWGIDNLKFSGGTFRIAGGPIYTKAVAVYGGSNITFDRAVVYGSAGESGITFAGTTNATVSNSVFHGLRSGIGFSAVNRGLATKNKIYEADSDGIDIADSHFVKATYNSCTNGNPGPGVHADCIQLFSLAGHPIQSDITISNNTAIGPTQGFTSFANGGGGLRLHIINNVVATSQPQGIACYDCIDSDISYNRVTTLPGSLYQTNVNVIGGSGNTVVGNFIGKKPAPAKAAAALRNISAFDPSAIAPGLIAAGSAADVPEPSAWTMLVFGFGAIGSALRRRAAGDAVMRMA